MRMAGTRGPRAVPDQRDSAAFWRVAKKWPDGTAGIGMGRTFDVSYTLIAPSGDQTSFTNKAMAVCPVRAWHRRRNASVRHGRRRTANTPEILSKLANDYLDSKASFEEELAALTRVSPCSSFPSVVRISTEVDEAVQEWAGAEPEIQRSDGRR